MCYSKCLVSRKGAIWVAAFCFKRLKKAQVNETDISSSVDKILRDEMNFESCRVLSYLLLGVVRIYSKKIEYLYHDCNKVLVKIKKFAIDTEENVCKETLRMSITVPDRFELDTFDLEIVEDVSGCNTAPKEDITLKDVVWKDEGIGQFSLDKYQYEELDFCQNTCSVDRLILEDLQPSQLTNNYEEESVNLDHSSGVEGVRTEPIKLFIQDQQIDTEQTVAETALYEDDMHEERSSEKIISCVISQEDLEDVRSFTRREEEPDASVSESHQVGEARIKAWETTNSEFQIYQEIREVHVARISPRSMKGFHDDKCNKKEGLEYVKSSIAKETVEKPMVESTEKHYVVGKLTLQEKDSNKDGKKIKVNEAANTECQMHLENEVHEARDSPVSMERLQDDIFNKNDCMDPDKSPSAKETIKKLIEGSVKKHHKKGRLKLEEVSVEAEKFHMIPPESVILDITPQTKYRNDSVAKPKQGASTPESMRIPTPAVKEHARFSRKRKCVFDGLIVLPNEVLRQSIHDASDLICKRRKASHPVLAAWRASRVFNLPEGFYLSLLPCHALELQVLFSNKKIKMLNSIKIAETPVKLDESESQTAGKLELRESAPNTPPQCSTSQPNYFEDSKTTLHLDNVRPSSPHECEEGDKSLERDGEFHMVKEVNMGTSSPHASIAGERYFRKDEELDLMIEETNSIEVENSDLCGWSRRTTKVAKYLRRHFLDLRKQGEVLNFSQVLLGRAEKECARLFYEILQKEKAQ